MTLSALDALGGTQVYTVSFQFRQDATNVNVATNYVDVGLRVVQGFTPPTNGRMLWSEDWSGVTLAPGPASTSAGYAFDGDWPRQIRGISTSSTSFVTYSVDFSVDSDCVNCALYFDLNMPFYQDEEVVYHIQDISVSSPAIDIPAPTMVSLSPEAATVPTQGPLSAVPANPRTNCPHQWPSLANFDDPATWGGGSVPAEGSHVVIPAGSSVLLRSCASVPSRFASITVPEGSTLVFDDTAMSLDVDSITVNGQLWIGSETCRLYSEVSITFHGDRNTGTVDPAAQPTKGLVAAGASASVNIHGKQFHPTWTRLAATVVPGTRHVFLQEPTNWEVGQRIAVITTGYGDYDSPQDEIRTITALSPDGSTVYVDSAFTFSHYAGAEYQGEVQLLSRRVVVQGAADDSYPGDGLGFGGQTRVMDGATGRFSGLQAYRMGQTNLLGRYPLHFHLLGDASSNYIQDCSIVNSFYRAVVIHGSHGVTVSRTTAFSVQGHAFYLEDGVEENNAFLFNHGAHIRTISTPAAGHGQGGEWQTERPDLTQPADITAGAFYITNAYNRWVGNVASGGWAGFSFVNLATPIGPSSGDDVSPERRPLLEFTGNTCHSAGQHWWASACVYVGGRLQTNSDNLLVYNSGRQSRGTRSEDGSQDAWMTFTDTVAYATNMAIGHWGNRVEVVRLETHDVGRAGQLFGQALFSDSLVNAHSSNQGAYAGLRWMQGFELYDTWTSTVLSNVEFRNFDSPAPFDTRDKYYHHVIHGLEHSDVFKPQWISAFRDITFTNVNWDLVVYMERTGTGSSLMFQFIDFSSSFSSAGPAVVGAMHPWWWHPSSECYAEWGWETYVCPVAAGDGEELAIASLWWDVPGLYQDNWNSGGSDTSVIGWMAHLGTAQDDVEARLPVTMNPLYTGFTGRSGWFLHHDAGNPTSFTISTSQVPRGKFILLAMNYPAGTTFDVTVHQRYLWSGVDMAPIPEAASLSEILTPVEALRDDPATFLCPNTPECGDVVVCDTGAVGPAWFWDAGSGTLYLRVVDFHWYVKQLAFETEHGFTREGITIPTISNRFEFRMEASCPAGSTTTTTGGATVCTAPDTIPNPAGVTFPARPTPPPPPPPPEPTPPPEPPVTAPPLLSLSLSDVDSTARMVPFGVTFATAPVVVCTATLHPDGPAVVRVSSVSTTGFDVRLVMSEGGSVSGPGDGPVNCIAAAEGSYTQAEDGIDMYVASLDVEDVDTKSSQHAGTAVTWSRAWTNPVVLGQILTEVTPDFQTFFARSSSSRKTPPLASDAGFKLGRSALQCASGTPTERVGYIVMESGDVTLEDGTRIVSFLSNDVWRHPPTVRTQSLADYDLSGSVHTVVSTSGLDGADGAVATLSTSTSATQLSAFADEDLCGSRTSRTHTSEQQAVVVVQPSLDDARRVLVVVDEEEEEEEAFRGDDDGGLGRVLVEENMHDGVGVGGGGGGVGLARRDSAVNQSVPPPAVVAEVDTGGHLTGSRSTHQSSSSSSVFVPASMSFVAGAVIALAMSAVVRWSSRGGGVV